MNDDLISRKAALNVIYEMHVGGKDAVEKALPNTYGEDLREIAEQISTLPTVQPEQRHTNGDLIEREVVRDIIYSNQEPLNEHQLNKIPAVDANADLVRCKDCDMWNDDGGVYAHSCAVWSNPEDGYTRFTEPNDFCSYAERREESE